MLWKLCGCGRKEVGRYGRPLSSSAESGILMITTNRPFVSDNIKSMRRNVE
jgi:hypothetical protein